MSEFVEEVEPALAFEVANTVSTDDGVGVIVLELLLDQHRRHNIYLHHAVILRHVNARHVYIRIRRRSMRHLLLRLVIGVISWHAIPSEPMVDLRAVLLHAGLLIATILLHDWLTVTLTA